MNEKKQNFMDSKTIMAIVLSGVVFLLWNQYIQKKYPNMGKTKAVVSKEATNDTTADGKTTNGNALDSAQSNNNDTTNTQANSNTSIENHAQVKKFVEEKLHSYKSDNFSFDVSSKGMGLKNIVLNKYTDRDKKQIILGVNEGYLAYETNLIGVRESLDFNITKEDENTFVGKSTVGSTEVTKKIIINSKQYTFDVLISVSNLNDKFIGVSNYISDPIAKTEGGGLLSADRFNIQQFYVNYATDEVEREIVTDMISSAEEGKTETTTYSQMNAAAVGNQYFTLAFVNKSDILPKIQLFATPGSKTTFGRINHIMINKDTQFNVNYAAYFGPKSLQNLAFVSESLKDVIDFGFFGTIAKMLQKVLVFFNNIFGNLGVSIIVLTVLVRLILLPTALSSSKSMKNMAKLSPLIKDLKEKYKDDKQTLNTEIMQLYKTNKVNPVGGCLPMLLQLPIFFALYQVLGQTIELYQAPFMLWVQDLSAKDPYYVLPVLMGITMFMQQKLTPSTMEPAQQKIMQFMPLMFSFLMISLPSGLTLYIFISGLFGIVQQYYIMRDVKPKTA